MTTTTGSTCDPVVPVPLTLNDPNSRSFMYQVHPSRAEDPKNRFEFSLADGSVYSIPKIAFLPPSIALAVDENSVNGMVMLFEELMPDLLKKLTGLDQLLDLLDAWQKESAGPDGQISLGESVALPVS